MRTSRSTSNKRREMYVELALPAAIAMAAHGTESVTAVCPKSLNGNETMTVSIVTRNYGVVLHCAGELLPFNVGIQRYQVRVYVTNPSTAQVAHPDLVLRVVFRSK